MSQLDCVHRARAVHGAARRGRSRVVPDCLHGAARGAWCAARAVHGSRRSRIFPDSLHVFGSSALLYPTVLLLS